MLYNPQWKTFNNIIQLKTNHFVKTNCNKPLTADKDRYYRFSLHNILFCKSPPQTSNLHTATTYKHKILTQKKAI